MTNMRTLEIHKNALIIEPMFEFTDAVKRLYERFEDNTCKSAQGFDLGDCEGLHPYQHALNEIDAAIGQLKRYRASMQEISRHAHLWDSNDYCVICGADGRA